MDSTGPIGPRPKLPQTAPIKLPESVAPAEPVALPPKSPKEGMVKDGLELTPTRTCKCATGQGIPGQLNPIPVRTMKGCLELPAKTIGIACGGPEKTAPGMCCFVPSTTIGPVKTTIGCGIGSQPVPTMACPGNLPNIPIKTLKTCNVEPAKTMICNIGPIPKTAVFCNPGPIEPPIKTAKICSIIPPHPPIKSCWCLPEPTGPVKTIGPVPGGPSIPQPPIKTINPAPTPRCIEWPPTKPEAPVKTIDIIHNPPPTPQCKIWPPVNPD